MKRPLLLIPLLLLMAGSSRAQEDWPPALRETFNKGVQAQKAGRLDEAEKAFLEVLRQGGKASFVYNNLGIVYQQRDDHRRAIQQFREALKIEPGYAQPRALLGASLLATGQPKEAVLELERAVKQLPREPLVRLSLAIAYERTGNLEEQVDQLRVLREQAPKEPEYAYRLARAYTKLSAAYYERIPGVNRRSPRFYQMVGETYFLQGRYERAIPALERAAKADPTLPGIHLTLAQIYLEQGKLTEAREEVERELSVMPGSALALELRKKLESRQAAPQQ